MKRVWDIVKGAVLCYAAAQAVALSVAAILLVFWTAVAGFAGALEDFLICLLFIGIATVVPILAFSFVMSLVTRLARQRAWPCLYPYLWSLGRVFLFSLAWLMRRIPHRSPRRLGESMMEVMFEDWPLWLAAVGTTVLNVFWKRTEVKAQHEVELIGTYRAAESSLPPFGVMK